jgi:hypothetical protein
MAAFEDEETQRRGGIGIAFFNVGNAEHQFNDFSYIVALQNMFLNVLPMHVTGAHFCYSDNKFMRFISLALSVIENKKTTAVHKMHSGSPTEIKYAVSKRDYRSIKVSAITVFPYVSHLLGTTTILSLLS